jgi:hypothetical protein
MRCDAGIVISASHNPFQDNGIKLFARDGFKLPDEVEAEMEDLVFNHRIETMRPTADAIGKATRIDDALGRYISYLKETFPKAWGKPPEESRLMHSAGIIAMGRLMDRVMGSINPVEPTAVATVKSDLQRVKRIPLIPIGIWNGHALDRQLAGILGLGKHGRAVASVAAAFGMKVTAWGPTLTDERAEEAGVERIAADPDAVPPGGESLGALRGRVGRWLDGLAGSARTANAGPVIPDARARSGPTRRSGCSPRP